MAARPVPSRGLFIASLFFSLDPFGLPIARANAFATKGLSAVASADHNLFRRVPPPHRRNPPSAPLLSRGGGGSSFPGALHDTTMFDTAPLIQSFVTFAIANGLGFVVSVLTGSHVHLDLLGTGAFAVAALPPLLGKSASDLVRVKVSSAAVALWGTKLALFLFWRATRAKTDARLETLLGTVGGTAVFWTISIAWGLICSLPHTIGTTSSLPGNNFALTTGTALYGAGLAVETIADLQKAAFKANNPKQFCNVGLWKISQHPNWFGNLLLWVGILIMNAPALVEPIDYPFEGGGILSAIGAVLWSYRRLGLALLSPSFMWALFRGQADGTMGDTPGIAMKRYGDDPDFLKYVENVPKIVPKFL